MLTITTKTTETTIESKKAPDTFTLALLDLRKKEHANYRWSYDPCRWFLNEWVTGLEHLLFSDYKFTTIVGPTSWLHLTIIRNRWRFHPGEVSPKTQGVHTDWSTWISGNPRLVDWEVVNNELFSESFWKNPDVLVIFLVGQEVTIFFLFAINLSAGENLKQGSEVDLHLLISRY